MSEPKVPASSLPEGGKETRAIDVGGQCAFGEVRSLCPICMTALDSCVHGRAASSESAAPKAAVLASVDDRCPDCNSSDRKVLNRACRLGWPHPWHKSESAAQPETRYHPVPSVGDEFNMAGKALGLTPALPRIDDPAKPSPSAPTPEKCPNCSGTRNTRLRSHCVMMCPPVNWKWVTDERATATDEIECAHPFHDSPAPASTPATPNERQVMPNDAPDKLSVSAVQNKPISDAW
jgi:hypothetical protein